MNEHSLKEDIFKKKKILLAVGRLTKQKNFAYLIDEFYKFYVNNNNYSLVILGDGEEYSNLKKKIKIKKLEEAVFLVGRVNNVLKYMKASMAFILSSKWEEMGFVIIEAAMANLFIISSNCPNGPSEFLNYGKNGILFESNKKDSLYQSLLRFDNLDKVMKKKDRFEIKKNSRKFSMFNHFIKMNEILEII